MARHTPRVNIAKGCAGRCSARKGKPLAQAAFPAILLLFSLSAAGNSAGEIIQPCKPNTIAFDPVPAKFVRFVITAADSGSQPCLDELEIYGTDDERNLALGGIAAASSCLPGHAIHQIAHLNDGVYGNPHSWIAAGTGEEWVEIALPEIAKVGKVVFSRDRLGQYRDRVPVDFAIHVSVDGQTWTTVKTVSAQVAGTQLSPTLPRPPAPPVRLPAVAQAPPTDTKAQMQYAFLGEEHAWLKTHGRADLSPSLVPYNGRVKEYPHHVGDDTLPLPPLVSAPTLDADLDDACWRAASRGVARVAYPYDFSVHPLVNCAVTAGRFGDRVYFAVEVGRLLSGHVAAVAAGSGQGCGAVACDGKRMTFNTFAGRRVKKRQPIEGLFNEALTRFEFWLPLEWFPGCEESGLRVGLGLGGKHTSELGRPVHFSFSPLAIAEEGPCVDSTFRVRMTLAPAAPPMTVSGNAPGLEGGLPLAPGESKTISVAGQAGGIGPAYDLVVRDSRDRTYALHLFRYNPLARTLSLAEELALRLEAAGVNVAKEMTAITALQERQAALMALPTVDVPAERAAFFEARLLKRDLFLRAPALNTLERVLLVKRHPFRPSHNYSVILDAPFRPGGGVYVMDVPRQEGRLMPEQARMTPLFEASEGIARTPMADFDLGQVYFAYRPSKDGYYHVWSMHADGSGLRQLTDGPFHDYWPCPLPDGGLAFITTRCRARYLCWRPQAAVMFRMDRSGGQMQPLSFANLTEWAPSVMEDGRIIWTRSEYLDKGADFGHTLWAIRPDGSKPELVFGNTIIQPNGYANGREVPGTSEICCTLISHFGDLNGPITLIDTAQGRFNPKAIRSITPEVPWPGAPPQEECFRDALPLARDYFLCSHAPRSHFCLYLLDRFGNRELLYADPQFSVMCPTLFQPRPAPPVVAATTTNTAAEDRGEFFMADVYAGIEDQVQRGRVKYLRIVEEVRADLEQLPNGAYRNDHQPFLNHYASPVDLVNGPFGWPTFVAKTPHGIVPVEQDGSARFYAPAAKVLYFQVLDQNLNELQRMRSVVQVQPGERRSCIGCHEGRELAPAVRMPLALSREPHEPQTAPWDGVPFSFERVVQPVLDAHCVSCHDEKHKMGLDFRGLLDGEKVPASYRTLITQGLVHYCDYGWNSGGCEKKAPLTFGTVRSKLWAILDAGHHGVELSRDEMHRIKAWIDLNCPLWPDYVDRDLRRTAPHKLAQAK